MAKKTDIEAFWIACVLAAFAGAALVDAGRAGIGFMVMVFSLALAGDFFLRRRRSRSQEP